VSSFDGLRLPEQQNAAIFLSFKSKSGEGKDSDPGKPDPEIISA